MEYKESEHEIDVWLLSGFFHSMPAKFVFNNGSLTLILLGAGSLWDRSLKKIARTYGKDETLFVNDLRNDRPVELFSSRINTLDYLKFSHWGYGMKIKLGLIPDPLKFSLVRPANTYYHSSTIHKVAPAVSLFTKRKAIKEWRALIERG